VVCLGGKDVPYALPGDNAVYHGGTDLGQTVASRLDLTLPEPPFDWLARLPRRYALRQVRYATVAEARRPSGPAFVKPADPADKCCDSGVSTGGWAIPERRGFPKSTAVLNAEPVAWEVESRCFLLEGQVTTLAPYARAGRWVRSRDGRWVIPEAEADEVTRFCRSLAEDGKVSLPPTVTLDVGRIEGRGWTVVERTRPGVPGCRAATRPACCPSCGGPACERRP
jgi:hypothetical protein